MAAVLGVNATKLATPIGANIIDQGINKAQLNVMTDSYEATALAATSTIAVGDKLPVGATIVDIIVQADDLGTSTGTLQVGDVGDDDRYIAAYAAGSATAKSLAINGKIDGFCYQVTGTNDDQIYIKTATAAITGTIKIAIIYAI